MTALPVIIGLPLASAGVIYLACEYFVNGVEWVGRGARPDWLELYAFMYI
jgi:hypothetical protein